jgi:exonuclease SbcD
MSFRFLHTADWHLGRVFFNVSLLEDQAHVLDQLVDLARETRADALVVAGDVYDRAVPPADAVRLLDETLARLALDLNCAVIMIAGNHDSADRLGFGAALMAERRCFLRGPLRLGADQAAQAGGDSGPVEINGRDGAARFYPIPYAEPAVVREHLQRTDLHSHDAALGAVIQAIGAPPPDIPNIAVGHCFAAGGAVSDSERPLSVGGAGQVSTAHFAGFDYTALGHLHRPQAVAQRVHYSGSLLKYSFSEAGDAKSVNLVELGDDGPRVERIALSPRRDLRIVEGHLNTLLDGPSSGEAADDYLLFRLLDTGALLDPMGRLRAVYPNALHLERPALEYRGQEYRGQNPDGDNATPSREQIARGDESLFADFFHQVTGEPLDAEHRAVLHEVLADLTSRERESDNTAPQTAGNGGTA